MQKLSNYMSLKPSEPTVQSEVIFHPAGSYRTFTSQRGKKLYCAFVDYEKAHDYFNRAVVFSNLTEFGATVLNM